MGNNTGIFSLIDEILFKYKNPNLEENEKDYTYKVEKIFNYQNYLFILFSKLYLDIKLQEGDSKERNHLYLITVDKKDRKIVKNLNENNIINPELYDILKNNELAKIIDFGEGKYINIDFNYNYDKEQCISILKNNGILFFNVQKYVNENLEIVKFHKFIKESSFQLISTFEDIFYDENNIKYHINANNENEPMNESFFFGKLYITSVNMDNNKQISVKPYFNNSETNLNFNYIDILNIINNKVPFFKLREASPGLNEDIEKYKGLYSYYSYFINNDVVTVRTVECPSKENEETLEYYTEIISVIRFNKNCLLCGTRHYIFCFNSEFTKNTNIDSKFKYILDYAIFDIYSIMNILYENLDNIKTNKEFNILIKMNYYHTYLTFNDKLIEETSIIDENKSELYNLENQTVITKNLMKIDYVKCYDIHEYQGFGLGEHSFSRFFISMNGRILISNNTLHDGDFEINERIMDLNTFEKKIELVDFYTINSCVNNIYIEYTDIDNNEFLCIASDRNELYIFNNLFKYKINNRYCYLPYVNYNNDGTLSKNCLKYIYNFNNLPLNINDDSRKNHYRNSYLPVILDIGSSVDDISICDKYINTLNTEFIKTFDNKIQKVNSIKYFKLIDDLILNEDEFNIEGNNKDENGLFDDSESYIKLETLNKNNFLIEEDVIDKYVMFNLRTKINNKEIKENDRYYIFNYQLAFNKEIEDTISDYYIFDEKYNLVNNSIIFEENDIYKNIYLYVPTNALNYKSDIIDIDDYHENLENRQKGLNIDTIIGLSTYEEFNELFKIEKEDEVFRNNIKYAYSFPLRIKYDITDILFPNEKINYELNNLPKKFTTRDYFVASCTNELNETINRLYFRWRYIGNDLINSDTYDYYILSFAIPNTENLTNKDLIKDISYLLRNYLTKTFDATNNKMDFVINKIDFTNKEYKWTSLNLPFNKNKCKLINLIVRKNKDDNMENSFWFDDIFFEEDINYYITINLNSIKTIQIPYEKVKIEYEEYIKFLEYMENVLVLENVLNNPGSKIEHVYQNGNKNLINLIFTGNIERKFITSFDRKALETQLMSNVFKSMTFINAHDYYFQDEKGFENTLVKIDRELFKKTNRKFPNKFFNKDYNSNIFKDFIKWRYGIDNYNDYEKYLWSLILDEEDILNMKINYFDGSSEYSDNKIANRWWLSDKKYNEYEEVLNLYTWENENSRNKWFFENYMPLYNNLYDNEVNLYTKNVFNNGMKYNPNNKDLGLINLTNNIANLLHYSIEKRLITGVYIDGLKLFNEIYYFKDNLNNTQDILINQYNVKNYFANTEKFNYFNNLILQSISEMKKYNDDKTYNPKINLKNILSNIEVNTNYGLISEQEKLVAYIEIKNFNENLNNNISNITRTVKSLNDNGGYYINSNTKPGQNNDLTINPDKLDNYKENVFKDQLILNLEFNDEYLYNIINNNDKINIYISYHNDIGKKYARRINPKFVKIHLEKQNVLLTIKGYFTYESLSTIYIVTGDINNHNLFFENIDKDIEYVDLAEISSNNNLQLFKYLSYDNIIKSTDIEINMNGYILYPNIDYNIINGKFTKENNNLILFRNKIPSDKDIYFEINLRPDSDAKIFYKTYQAYSLNYENFNLSKNPIAKTITMDNDRYSFIQYKIDNKYINKFDLYINNMKVPNKFIEVVNTKTIKLAVNNEDYCIDLHKTNLAIKNNDLYELTNEYDETKEYRFFDPEYKNIMIVFQNKFSPYNYEMEIENKYSENNFKSLLQNLFFKLKETKSIDILTDSCYVKSNDYKIIDNFDWLCKTENNSPITNFPFIPSDKEIYDCNEDNLETNVIIESQTNENEYITEDIIIDSNPKIDETDENDFEEIEFDFPIIIPIDFNYILIDKDPVNLTCTLAMYIGTDIVDSIPDKVQDPLDDTDENIYKPTAIESTCFNYCNKISPNGLNIGKHITKIF